MTRFDLSSALSLRHIVTLCFKQLESFAFEGALEDTKGPVLVMFQSEIRLYFTTLQFLGAGPTRWRRPSSSLVPSETASPAEGTRWLTVPGWGPGPPSFSSSCSSSWVGPVHGVAVAVSSFTPNENSL